MSRYNIEFTEDQENRLVRLKKRIGAKSKAEVIRRALELLDTIESKKRGAAQLLLTLLCRR